MSKLCHEKTPFLLLIDFWYCRLAFTFQKAPGLQNLWLLVLSMHPFCFRSCHIAFPSKIRLLITLFFLTFFFGQWEHYSTGNIDHYFGKNFQRVPLFLFWRVGYPTLPYMWKILNTHPLNQLHIWYFSLFG